MTRINKAFIFDMNGTMVDDMAYHVKAWYNLLTQDLDAKLSFEEVSKEMYGKNSEVMERVFGKGRFTQAEMDFWGLEKEKRYQDAYLPNLKLIDGLQQFFDAAYNAQIPMSIGSAAIPFNINFVLDNLHLHQYFKAVVSADDVAISKPHPETFTKAAALMGVAPEHCVVFEDAPKGVEAAQNAGMHCVVITTMHEPEAFKKYKNIICFIKDYKQLRIEDLI
ncbi:HAD family hydrolase [Parasediminibacterium paludis]|uniref:HAD family hydrolase n=1 Tax=Parasediminibacterium paludis TaxID=908966 RepID=A0ABV8Q0H2_9BACT